MRYKAMAKKLRQLVELDDPIPAEAVLANEEDLQNICADENINENTDNYTNENTDKRTTECTNEYINDCTNESTDKCTNDRIVEYTDTSSNSLQNRDSNSTDNKNAITMRNKFALFENCRGESGDLSNGMAIDGVEGGDLPRECADESGELSKDKARDGDEGRELPRNVADEGRELTKDRARDGGEDRDLSQWDNSGELSADNFVNNRLTIEDRKRNSYQILRAIAIYKEVVDGVNGVTQLMARIDAFLDPERIEEATTLAQWREKYKNEIILQNKFKWWKK